jgi:hypothetical protein
MYKPTYALSAQGTGDSYNRYYDQNPHGDGTHTTVLIGPIILLKGTLYRRSFRELKL